MAIPFAKLHGLGNDFVLVDCRERDYGEWAELAPRIAHRRTGIGCDQVLLLRSSTSAAYRMDIFNADGSRAEMCGNGIRCLALYLRVKGICADSEIPVETLAGVVVPRFRGNDIEVDLGSPEFEGRKLPADWDGPVQDHPLPLAEGAVKVTCVSMGNPHAVVFVDDADSYPVEAVGPALERHPFFPRRTNAEFVQVRSEHELRMRVWERGAGVTMACGTGAAAAAVAAHWTGRAGAEVRMQLDGGVLKVRWDRAADRVYIEGPAALVFEGSYLPG